MQVNLWGYISPEKSKLFLIPDKFKAVNYIDVLRKALPELSEVKPDYILVEDNARIHTAKATKEYKQANKIQTLANWPPYSPDLNIIETIWARMVKHVHKVMLCKGEPRFKNTLFNWCEAGFELACTELSSRFV